MVAPALQSGDLLIALAAALLAFLLYFRTLAPGLLGGDSGEFQFAAWLAGFVHPTGYPLYLILGYLWSHLLPWHDPAWRMNAFSAFWGGVATSLTYLLARRILAVGLPANQPTNQLINQLTTRLPALFAALTFAVTPTFWSQAVIAEVYTLHAAFVAAVLLGLVSYAASRNSRTLYATAALYGLSLAHHRTMLLLAPTIALYLWLNRRAPQNARSTPRSALSTCLLVSLCLLLPLLLYAYLPLRGPQTPYAQVRVGPGQELALYEPTAAGFLTQVSGRTFQGAIGDAADAAARIGPTIQKLANEVTWGGIALGLAGLIALARRNRRLLALTGLSFTAIVAFNLFYGIGDIAAFYIPAYLIWALWTAVGVDWGQRALSRALRTACPVVPGAAYRKLQTANGRPSTLVNLSSCFLVSLFPCFLALLLPAYLLITHFGSIDQSRNTQAREAWTRILAAGIPQDAILVSNDRDEMMPLWYMQQVESVRPDLTGLFPLIRPEAAWADVGALLDRSLASGRPVWLVKPMPGLEVKARLETIGPVARVLGPAVGRAPPAGGHRRLCGCDPPGWLRSGPGWAAPRRAGDHQPEMAAAPAARYGLHHLRPTAQRRRSENRPKRPASRRRLLPHLALETRRDVG